MLLDFLESKVPRQGGMLLKVDRFFPSSKTCSDCGTIHEMPLSSRRMVCECGCDMDRDLNAAINIRRQALAHQSVENEALAVASVTTKLHSAKQKIVGLCSYA